MSIAGVISNKKGRKQVLYDAMPVSQTATRPHHLFKHKIVQLAKFELCNATDKWRTPRNYAFAMPVVGVSSCMFNE